MPRNFYFGKEANIVTGSANFATLISTGFAGYGLTTGQATSYGTLNTALQTAYSTAIEPSTRTRGTIAVKNAAIKAMRASAINLAKIVYSTPTVTDAQLIDLGLLPRSARTPVPPPSDAPVLEVGTVSGRLVSVRVHAVGTDRRGKPFGARSANLYSYVGATAPSDPTVWRFEGTATRTITQIQFSNSVANGAQVWLSASWVSNRGATSPSCDPVGFIMQGGAALPEAA